MRLLKRTLLVLCAIFLAALVCLIFYALSGPRDIPLRHMVPADSSLCLAVMDLGARWPEVASSDLWKRLAGIKLVPEKRSFLQIFLEREAIAFFSPQSGLCVSSRIAPWQRPAELLWRLWNLAFEEDWSRERYRGIELIRIKSVKDRPAITYFIYGDLGFLMLGAEPSQARGLVDLLLGDGGWGAEALADYAPDHFISLYLRPAKLMEFDLRGEYERAKKKYPEENLPPCWVAVEEIDRWLVENGSLSLFEIYSQMAASMDEDAATIGALDIKSDNAVIEWRRTGLPRSSPGGAGLADYAAFLPGDVLGVVSFDVESEDAVGLGPFPVMITPMGGDIQSSFDEKVEKLRSSIEGSTALAMMRPSLFSSLLPACALFKLKGKEDITNGINAVIDLIEGRKLEIIIPGYVAMTESRVGHKKKTHGGFDYYVLRKSDQFVWSYAQLDDILVVATHSNVIKILIDARDETSPMLSASQRFLGAVAPVTGRGEVQGFLDLMTIGSNARTALDLYVFKEALTSHQPPGASDQYAPLRFSLEIMEAVGTVAWEGAGSGGKIVVPMNVKI